jgi:hypothetical protein
MARFSARLVAALCLGTVLVALPPAVRGEGEEDVEVFEEEVDVEGDEYEEEGFEDEPYSVLYVPSPDVSISHFFPDHPDKVLPLGEKVTVLLGLNNAGDKLLNVSYLGAQLHSPFDLSYFIQNYTTKEVWAAVLPQSELTISYTFTADPSLEARDYHLSGYIFYNSSDNQYAYRNTWTNATVTFVDNGSGFDVLILATWLIIVVIFLGIVYGIAHVTGQSKRLVKTVQGQTKRPPSDLSDWDVKDVYRPKALAARKKKKNGKKQH